VKKSIETVQGADVYPAAQQMLIHQGKVLKDATTLEENKVAENSFIVIMLSKVTFSLVHLFIFKSDIMFHILYHNCINLFYTKLRIICLKYARVRAHLVTDLLLQLHHRPR